jgi:hypothetical protein
LKYFEIATAATWRFARSPLLEKAMSQQLVDKCDFVFYMVNPKTSSHILSNEGMFIF